MESVFPFIYSGGKLSWMAVLGFALAVLIVMWALARIPFLRAVKP